MKKKTLRSIIVLATALGVFIVGCVLAAPAKNDGPAPAEYSSYERGKVKMILSDSTVPDPASDGGYRGDQLMIVEVTTGKYAGKELQVYNYVGPLYGEPLSEG